MKGPAERQAAVRSWSMRDGAALAFRHWKPRDARGALVAIHGIQSHSGWYGASCSTMAEAGYEVLFLDRRGSGMNRFGRGDVSDWRVFERDLIEVLQDVRRRMGRRPVHLQAISWGTKLACATLIEHPDLATSLTLIGPALVPRVDVTFTGKLKVALAMVTNPRRLFDIPLSDPRLFTDNPERLEYIRNDPASLRRCTARFLFQTRGLDAFVRRNAPRLRTPLLVMMAGRDRIVDNEAVRRLAERFASDPKEIILYEDASHTLEFERDPAPIFRDMISWLNRWE